MRPWRRLFLHLGLTVRATFTSRRLLLSSRSQESHHSAGTHHTAVHMAWSYDDRVALMTAMADDPGADQPLQFGVHRGETHRAVLVDYKGYILWAFNEQRPGPRLQRLLQWASRYCHTQGAQLLLQPTPPPEDPLQPTPTEPAGEPAQGEPTPQPPPVVEQLRALLAQPLTNLNQAQVWTSQQNPDDAETIQQLITLIVDLHH